MGASPSDPHLDAMTRKCARPYSHLTNEYFWLMKKLGNLGAKQNFIFSVPTTCPKPVT